MKCILTLLLALTGIPSFAQHSIKTDSVYISGKVNGYIASQESPNAVIFIINDIIIDDQVNLRAKIKSDGTYKIAFLKTGPQDIYIEYNDHLETIIVSPGDHMQVSFDAANIDSTLSFSGDNAQTNRDLKAYTAAVDKENIKAYGNDHYGRYKVMAASEKDNQPDAHKKILTDRLIKEEAYLKDYIKQHKLSPVFIKWATTDLQCEYISNLMRYRWIHADVNGMKTADFKLPENYFDFTKNVSPDDPELAISSNYNSYLHDYGMYLRKTFVKSNLIDDAVALTAKQPRGFAKDVMLSNIIYDLIGARMLEPVKPYLDTLKSNVTYPVFENRILEAYNSAVNQQNNYKLPANAQINTTPKTEADSLFNKIVAKYPNKVIYVDFWATWCGPCRAEMPNSKILHDQYLNKDVVFLYLGVQSEEKAWKAMIAELDIKGEHFLLDKNEFAALAERFRVNGIPHYLLVDKKGIVVDDNALRPGDNTIKPRIEALLNAK